MSIPRAIALDYGTKKTGLAYSVESFAFSWKTVPTKELGEILPKCIKDKNTEILIVGMPYNIDGTMSVHGKRVQKFGEKLKEITHLPIIYHDERLTSSEAHMAFDEMGISGDIDAEAARLILDAWMSEQL